MRHEVLIAETEAWLIEQALGDTDLREMFGEVCERLYGIGVAVERAALSWPTLHPLFRAEQVAWKVGQGATHTQFRHETGNNENWLASPFYYVVNRDIPRLRRRLVGTNALIDFPVLEDLQADGYTDYLVTATPFQIAEFESYAEGRTGTISTWATKRQEGFSDDDLQSLSRIQRMLAVACHSAIQKQVMTNLATAYLGPTAGWRVLSGTIQRGAGDVIKAVVWFSDLRGSTRLSETMHGEEYLALLNAYYECTAAPVVEHGGEILNFIGDGVLAIFPTADGPSGAKLAVEAATKAARAAIARRDEIRAAGIPGGVHFDFGIALAIGKVMFGNIGIPQRLAFSGIGQVVNEVHRIEQATKTLNTPVLGTGMVAKFDDDDWISMGSPVLDGVNHDVELFTPTWAMDQETRSTANAMP